MNISTLDIDSIELKRFVPKLYGKNIMIITPPMNIPFGLEDVFGKYQLKLRFNNYKTDHTMRQFYNQIIDLENRLQTISQNTEYHSNVKKTGSYDPLLVIRVQGDNTELMSKVSGLKKGGVVIARFELYKQWNYNGRSGTTFNLLDVDQVDG